MNYPVYISGKTPILASDLNRLREQLRAQAQAWVAPPLSRVSDTRGLSFLINQETSVAPAVETNTTWQAGWVHAQTTDGSGNPLYIFRIVTLNADGTITDPGNPDQYASEASNNPDVEIPCFEWIQPGNIFFDPLKTPPEASVWSSDYRLIPAERCIPFGQTLGVAQTIPARFHLRLSSLQGCGNVNGTQIQMDLQNVAVTDLFGEPGYGSANFHGPCNPTFSGDVQNQDVQDLLTISEFQGPTVFSQWAWFGGKSNADKSIWSAVILYTPASYFPGDTPPEFISFDRLAFQLYLLYRSRPTARPAVAFASCDSYYLPSVGSPADGFNGNVSGRQGVPGTYDVGFAGTFAATFVLGYNSGGPCRGNILCLVQGESPLPLGTVGSEGVGDRRLTNNNLLGHDGGAGCDTATLTIS